MNYLYLDIETTGLDPFRDRVTLIQTLRDGRIRIGEPTEGNIATLRNLFEDHTVVGHNLKFDLKFLKHRYHIEPIAFFDTWIAEILISGGIKARQKGSATLESVAKEYTGIQLNKDEKLRQSFLGGELTPEQIQYAAYDVAVLPEIHTSQQQILTTLGLERVFEIEMACLPATIGLELSGIPLDLEGLKNLESETRESRESAKLQVLTILKESGYRHLDLSGLPQVNLDSPVQLLGALQTIGLEVKSTNDRIISAMEHPIGKAIKDYRKQQKLLNTFLEKLPKHINPATNKIHADFNQQGTQAGRFSCSKPNLQQLPRDNRIRRLFKGNNGSIIITADYSQMELRILVEVSQEPKMIDLFKKDGDLHKLTASLIFNKPLEQVTKEERHIAKSINFGLSYGMGTGGLQANLRENGIAIDLDKASEYIRSFFKNYPHVNVYLESAGKFAADNAYIRNKAGRIIKYKPPKSEKEWAAIAREGKNNPIQSLNADIIKLAMGRLYKKLQPYSAKLINVVHDELVFEVPGEHAEIATKLIKEEMEAAGREFLQLVPIIVEVNAGEAWEKE